MKWKKEKFLKTEMGGEMINCIKCWELALNIRDLKTARWCQAQWEVYKMALRQFYGMEYAFSRTSECYGIVNENDYSDWLFCEKYNKQEE